MENFKIDKSLKWDYENGFYLTCGKERIGKLLNHIEIYKRILELPGDIIEFGVFKGSSIMRLLYLRELFENTYSRKIIGFDIFGKFPNDVSSVDDKKFIEKFESDGGFGISLEDLKEFIENSDLKNIELVKGDITKSLPSWLDLNKEKRFSLVHIDVDVYEPTKVILDLIWDKLVPGGILLLDDYGTVYGETTGVEEFFKSKNIKYKIHKERFYKIPAFIIKEQ